MSGSVNKVIIVGNLGADPEVRTFQNGGKVCNLRIATSEAWKDKQSGERKERTEWHSVAIFSEPLAGIAEKYLRKGSKVYIEGQLRTRKWQDQAGNDRYTTEIVAGELQMLDSKGENGDSNQSQASTKASRNDAERDFRRPHDEGVAPSKAGQNTQNASQEFEEDDIPF